MSNRIVESYQDFLENRGMNESLFDKGLWAELIKQAKGYLSKPAPKEETKPDYDNSPKPIPGDGETESPEDVFVGSLVRTLQKRGTLPDELDNYYYKVARKQTDEIGGPDVGVLGSIDDLDDEARRKLSPSEFKNSEELAVRVTGANHIEKPDPKKLGRYEYDVTDSFSKYTYSDYVDLVKEKSEYWKEVDEDKWVLLGIRNKLNIRNEYPNGFVDAMVLLSPRNDKKAIEFPATTFPGVVYRVLPYRAWMVSRGKAWLAESPSSEGVAVLKPGIYDYSVGTMTKIGRCLVQKEKVPVYRMSFVNKPELAGKIHTYSPGSPKSDYYGLNIHHAGNDSPRIDNWSAGCQVLKKKNDMRKILEKAEDNGGDIKYILIEI